TRLDVANARWALANRDQFHMVKSLRVAMRRHTVAPRTRREVTAGLTGGSVRDPQGEPADLIRSVSRALRVLESVGATPRGLTVKQIARRCDLTVATTYHLVRTLAYEGYLVRRDDGTYGIGLEVSDRYRELVGAFRAPVSVSERLRKAAVDTGYSHFLGKFVNGRVALTCVAEGHRSPYLEDLVPGFDDGAHATAMGKALLATLRPDERIRYVRESGM